MCACRWETEADSERVGARAGRGVAGWAVSTGCVNPWCLILLWVILPSETHHYSAIVDVIVLEKVWYDRDRDRGRETEKERGKLCVLPLIGINTCLQLDRNWHPVSQILFLSTSQLSLSLHAAKRITTLPGSAPSHYHILITFVKGNIWGV